MTTTTEQQTQGITTKTLEPWRGRQRILVHDPSDTRRPWRIEGEGNAWYFQTEAEAMAYYERERAPRRPRRSKWG